MKLLEYPDETAFFHNHDKTCDILKHFITLIKIFVLCSLIQRGVLIKRRVLEILRNESLQYVHNNYGSIQLTFPKTKKVAFFSQKCDFSANFSFLKFIFSAPTFFLPLKLQANSLKLKKVHFFSAKIHFFSCVFRHFHLDIFVQFLSSSCSVTLQ